MGKKNIPCNLGEIEAREVFEQFDQWLDQKEEELVIETLQNFLFYEADHSGKIRNCICTHANCGKFTMERKYESRFFHHKHGDKITCPVCGNDVKLVAMGRMQNFSTLNQERWVRVTICREGKDGALLLLSGYAHREYSHYDLKPPPEIAWKCLTYLAPGKRGQWEHRWTRDYQNQHGYWAWGLRETVGEPFSPGGFGYQQHDGDSWFLYPEAIVGSALRYCQLEEYMYQESKLYLDVMQEPIRMATKYLAYYTRYPTMEMAVKLGLGKAVTDLIADGKKNHRDLNWDATTIQGFLRLDKQDSKIYHHYGGGLPMLQGYHKAKKYGLTPNMKHFVEQLIAAEAMEHIERVVDAAVKADQTIQVAANYITKFRPTLNAIQVLTLWGDYLNMARILGYDLTRRDVVMPKDLQDRHDAASETLRFQKITVDELKYADFNKFLRKMYEFEYGDLCIVVPGSVEDIVNEGKTLGHCVGGYAARHFDNKVTILFLRHKRKPNTPWITMEIVPRNSPKDKIVIRQIPGYRNELYKPSGGKKPARPSEKYKWFLDIWKSWVKAGSKRDKKGKPILPKSKEKTA